MVLHEWLDDLRVEACVHLAAKDGRRDVEAAADLALCETVDVLREVVRELPSVARGFGAAFRRERVCGDDVEVQEEADDEGGYERRGRPEAGLMHVREAHACLVEWRQFLQ